MCMFSLSKNILWKYPPDWVGYPSATKNISIIALNVKVVPVSGHHSARILCANTKTALVGFSDLDVQGVMAWYGLSHSEQLTGN